MYKSIIKLVLFVSVFVNSCNVLLCCSNGQEAIGRILRDETELRQQIITEQRCLLARYKHWVLVQQLVQSAKENMLQHELFCRDERVLKELVARRKIQETCLHKLDQVRQREELVLIGFRCRAYIDEIMDLQRRGEQLDPIND